MTNPLQSLLTAGLLLACATGTLADEPTIYHGPANKGTNAEARAAAGTKACFEAFIKELVPGSNPKARTIDLANGQVFGSNSLSNEMTVSMSAQSSITGKELATGDCTVTRDAKVVALYTRMTRPAQLAGLKTHEIKLAYGNR